MKQKSLSVLVTGGAGFIGSHMVDYWRQKKANVVVIDNLSSGKKEWLPSGVELHQFNLCKTDQIIKILLKYQPKIIHHFAGHTQLREALIRPAEDSLDNLQSTVSLIQACLAVTELAEGYKPEQIVFSSTSAVYGSCLNPPFSEETETSPNTPYGIAKVAAEEYLKWYAKRSGVKVTLLRYGNVYGPRQSTSGEAGVVAKFMDALAHNQPLSIYGDGTHLRDYIYVSDVVDANMAVIEHKRDGCFVVGTGVATSTNELAALCQKVVASSKKLKHVKQLLPEQAESWLDAIQLRQSTHWQPKVALAEGLESTWSWYQKHDR